MTDWNFLFNRYIKRIRIEKGFRFKWFPAPIREPFLEPTILTKGDIMIDVGANVGGWTIPASAFYQRVDAFEPNPEIRAVLNQNIKRNKIDNVNVEPVALGDDWQDGRALYIYSISSRAHGSDSFLKGHMGYSSTGRTIRVPVRPLDYYNYRGISLMKVDTEGWEIPVLRGAKHNIAKHRPTLVIETHLPNDDERIIGMHPEYAFESIEQNGQIWLVGRYPR